MANLSNANLSIKLIAGSSNTDTVARVNVALTQFELFLINSGGLRLQLRCKLIGADSGLTGGDDDLFVFPAQTVSNGGTFTFQSQVSRRTLDEDNGGDEVYAQFTLQSTEPSFPLVVSVKSNEISGNF